MSESAATDRALVDVEAIHALADELADLGYESIRDELVIATGTSLLRIVTGNHRSHRHVAAVRAQLEGLVSELKRGAAGRRHGEDVTNCLTHRRAV